jgi:hypothetical protein
MLQMKSLKDERVKQAEKEQKKTTLVDVIDIDEDEDVVFK